MTTRKHLLPIIICGAFPAGFDEIKPHTWSPCTLHVLSSLDQMSAENNFCHLTDAHQMWLAKRKARGEIPNCKCISSYWSTNFSPFSINHRLILSFSPSVQLDSSLLLFAFPLCPCIAAMVSLFIALYFSLSINCRLGHSPLFSIEYSNVCNVPVIDISQHSITTR